MMFGFAKISRMPVAMVAAALALMSGPALAGELGTAVVPKTIIYPGQEISAEQVNVVDVTNPNLVEGYARSLHEVEGKVTTKTLLPGRTIMLSALREQWTVRRGDKVVLVYANGGLRITAAGTPLSDATAGALIKVRNTDTGVIISGTVMADGSVLVAQK